MSLELFRERLAGANPPVDWPASFNVAECSAENWEAVKRGVTVAYEEALAALLPMKDKPVHEWPGINVAGLVATIAHNAYHLGAIRQIAKAVRGA